MYSIRQNSQTKAGTILTYALTIEIQKYSSQIENIVKSLLLICHVNSKSNQILRQTLTIRNNILISIRNIGHRYFLV